MSKLTLNDSVADVITKMSEGNPGALNAMMDILDKHDGIDPQAGMGGIGVMLLFDSWGIYGSKIYVLWNDKCDRSVRRMLVLTRSVQLGLLPQQKLINMASDNMSKVDLTDDEWQTLDASVCKKLKDFAPGE